MAGILGRFLRRSAKQEAEFQQLLLKEPWKKHEFYSPQPPVPRWKTLSSQGLLASGALVALYVSVGDFKWFKAHGTVGQSRVLYDAAMERKLGEEDTAGLHSSNIPLVYRDTIAEFKQ